MTSRTPREIPAGRIAWLAAIAVFLTSAGAGEAAQAMKRFPYQKYVTSTCGGGNPACFVDVDKVKAGQRVEIESVSCFVSTAASSTAHFVALQSVDQGEPKYEHDYIEVAATTVDATTRRYVAARKTTFVADAGDTLTMYLSTSGSPTGLRCKVSGTRVKLG